MRKYIIKTELAPEYDNAEYEAERPATKECDADGFFLITLRDGELYGVSCFGMSTMELAKAFKDDGSEASATIRSAFAIAEGLEKADRIREEARKRNVAKELADLLRAE